VPHVPTKSSDLISSLWVSWLTRLSIMWLSQTSSRLLPLSPQPKYHNQTRPSNPNSAIILSYFTLLFPGLSNPSFSEFDKNCGRSDQRPEACINTRGICNAA
jgi:hypothetical protein